MFSHVTRELTRFVISVLRDDEEDLIDYGDYEFEAEASSNQEAGTTVAIEGIGIFVDDATHAEVPESFGQRHHTEFDAEEPSGKPTEEPKQESTEGTAAPFAARPASKTQPTTRKGTEAAITIKDLNELLTDVTFRTALGLVTAGNDINVNFWVGGLDFTLSLNLVGLAEVKACMFGANCRDKDSTFEHSGADRTATTADKKPQKLCNKANTTAGCSRGGACWFSHELLDVACADGDLRATCVKGMYCSYKDNDDKVIFSVEHIEQDKEGVAVKGDDINEVEASAQRAPDYPTPAPPVPAPGTAASSKQQARGVKCGREPED